MPGLQSYESVFTSEKNFCFDETGIEKIYDYLKIPVYRSVHFAHLEKYAKDFFCKYLPTADEYKNKNQIFSFINGNLQRIYAIGDDVFKEDFMYIHFFCRSMKIEINDYNKAVIIYPNTIESYVGGDITAQFVRKKAHMSKIRYVLNVAKRNWRKVSPKKILGWLREHNKQKKREHDCF